MANPSTENTVETSSQSKLDSPWSVVVLNDPVNLMTYVTYSFQKIFGYDRRRAHQHMLEVHKNGRSRLWTGPREKAEHYSHLLHQWQLNSIIQKEDA